MPLDFKISFLLKLSNDTLLNKPVKIISRGDEMQLKLWFQTHLWSRGYFKSSSYSVMEAGPAGHIGRNINVTAVQIYHSVPGGGTTWGKIQRFN